MSERRVVRLLEEKTPRQLAQIRYRRSVRGRLAQRRSDRKRSAKPKDVERNRARWRKWVTENRLRRRVYERTYKRVHYKPRGLPVGTAHLQVTRTCHCGRAVRGNAFTSHTRSCGAARAAS